LVIMQALKILITTGQKSILQTILKNTPTHHNKFFLNDS